MSKHKHTPSEGTHSEELTQETSPDNVAEVQSASFEERISQLEQDLNNAHQVKDEHYNRMLRIQADFDNFRRRSKQEYEQICMFAGEDLVKKILPVLDSLERAIGHAATDCQTSWLEGVQLTLKQFQDIMRSEGLEAIPADNVEFDPQVHEAIAQEQSDNVAIATVVAEMQRGYKFRGKVIRPALVKVAIP